MFRSGSSSRLATLDNSYLQVNSSQGQTSWYARFNAIPNTLKSLRSPTTARTRPPAAVGVGLELDHERLGRARRAPGRPRGGDVTAVPAGALADYVANVSGNGDVAVKVSCARSDLAPFYASGDQLRIQYTP